MIAEKRKRLFIGIACQPTRPVRQLLADLRSAADDPATGLRPVPEENLHVTLKFLGMVPETDIAMICQVIQQAVAGQPSIVLHLQGFGSFRQALWLGFKECRELRDLAANLDQALTAIGVAREQKRFTPHVTVARLRSDAGVKIAELQAAYGHRDWQTISVDKVQLFESETGPEGARYSSLFSVPLAS